MLLLAEKVSGKSRERQRRMAQSQSQVPVLILQSLQIRLIQLAVKMTLRWASMTPTKPSQRHNSRSRHLKRIAIPKAIFPRRSQGRAAYLARCKGG